MEDIEVKRATLFFLLAAFSSDVFAERSVRGIQSPPDYTAYDFREVIVCIPQNGVRYEVKIYLHYDDTGYRVVADAIFNGMAKVVLFEQADISVDSKKMLIY